MVKSVFISSTSEDLEEYRETVTAAVNAMNLAAIDFKKWGSRPDGAAGASVDGVKHADYFVGILAHRYGYVPDGMSKSVTEQEYDAAVTGHIPRLMYLVDPKYEWPAEQIEADAAAQERLERFKASINRGEVRSFFTTPENLARRVVADLAAQIIKEQRHRRLSISLVIAFVLLLALALVPLARPDILVTLGIVTPPPMPPGFNVVVAGFGFEGSDGTIKSDLAADNVSDILLASVRQVSGISNIRGRGAPGVKAILASRSKDREAQAAQIANQLNATIVIYGLVKDLGNAHIQIAPNFYISPDFAATQPELMGAQDFGKPFTMLKDWTPTQGGELGDRLQTLEDFLSGLADYYNGDYAQAQKLFATASAVDSNGSSSSGLEVLNIFAGNAATRQSDYQGALKLYSDTLINRPTYARGLLGRGVALFQIAGQSRRAQKPPIPYDPGVQLPGGTVCNQKQILADPPDQTKVEILIALAEVCYQEAAKSTDQIATADLDVKIPFQFGSLYLWRAQNEFGDYWNQAKQQLSQVIALYGAAPAEKQLRIHIYAAFAHVYLAGLLTTRSANDPTANAAALEHYHQAIALLQSDVDQPYAQTAIPQIQAVVATLTQGSQGSATAAVK